MKKNRLPFERRFGGEKSFRDLLYEQQNRADFLNIVEELEPVDVAFKLFPSDKETAWLFKEFELDEDNLFHWRALIEAFSRTYVSATRERLVPPPKIRLRLAHDLLEIHQNLKHSKWKPDVTLNFLITHPPYRERWAKTEKEALRKWVRNLVKEVGPVDEKFAERAERVYWPNWVETDVPPEWRHFFYEDDDDDEG